MTIRYDPLLSLKHLEAGVEGALSTTISCNPLRSLNNHVSRRPMSSTYCLLPSVAVKYYQLLSLRHLEAGVKRVRLRPDLQVNRYSGI